MEMVRGNLSDIRQSKGASWRLVGGGGGCSVTKNNEIKLKGMNENID
jgi:hypothetical protein